MSSDTHKYHTVKARETLSGIAHIYGLSVQQLYKLNPHLSHNPRHLQIGTKLKLKDEIVGEKLRVSAGFVKIVKMVCMPDVTYVCPYSGILLKKVGGIKKLKVKVKTTKEGIKKIENIKGSNRNVNYILGSLSKKYESNGNPGTISTGKGDHGGVSYGAYQLSTNMGTVDDFMRNEGREWNNLMGLSPKTLEFNTNWKKNAKEHRTEFFKSQHDYIQRTHYEVQRQKLKKELALDVSNYSDVLKDVVWSISVQHGAKSNVIKNALKGKKWHNMSERDIISAIYEERASVNQKNKLLKYFQKTPSKKWQDGLKDRFKNEEKDALSKL